MPGGHHTVGSLGYTQRSGRLQRAGCHQHVPLIAFEAPMSVQHNTVCLHLRNALHFPFSSRCYHLGHVRPCERSDCRIRTQMVHAHPQLLLLDVYLQQFARLGFEMR
jgi:hypothetical protein